MQYFILYIQQGTDNQGDAATAATINGVLSQILDGLSSVSSGSLTLPDWLSMPAIPADGLSAEYVGGARVTRQTTLSFGTRRFTRVGALVQFPDGQDAQSTRDWIVALADYYFPRSGVGWGEAIALDYRPTTNGSVDWWQSGQAAATHTQNAFDLNQQLGDTSTVENPVGPQSATPPRDLNLNLPISIPTSNDVTSWMWIIGIGTVVYMFWPLLLQMVGDVRAKSEMAAASRRRRNPHGRHRHRHYRRAA